MLGQNEILNKLFKKCICTDAVNSNYFLSVVLLCLSTQCLFFLKLRAFTDNRDDTALGHVIVLLQHEWPRGENLFLKAINKICQQGNFQYENFFNYVTSILSLAGNVFHIQYDFLGYWESCCIVSAGSLCEQFSVLHINNASLS